MADETPKEDKTEEATPKRRDEAREKGQVAVSQDIVAAFMLLAALGVFLAAGAALFMALASLTAGFAGRLDAWSLVDFDVSVAVGLVTEPLREIMPPLAAVVVPMLAVGALVSYLQTGFQITPKTLELELSKIDPQKGLERMLGMRSVMRFLQASLKLVALASVVGLMAWSEVPRLAALAHLELGSALQHGAGIVIRTAMAGVIAILAIALIDLFFQRFQHEKDLRMSKQEVRLEYKNTQGDPEIKRRIRQIQREMSTRRMMSDVPNATVVVTNPTHYAVALYYEKGEDGQALVAAPKVVAKGVDSLAQRIKEVAREHDVVIYEDVPLARTLYARCEIGDLVPVEMFEAVATVIRHVWGLRRATTRIGA
jgi:flagellar biosynthetic protein FlhB